MKVIDCQQYDATWWNVRRGIPTASEFGSILTPKTMKLSSAADTYIDKLIADKFDLNYGAVDDSASLAMKRGTEAEPESRAWYAMASGVDVVEVGFCLTDSGRFGCSPDGLVGEDGGLELKNPLAKTHVGYLRAGKVLPDEYRCQVHGSLIVTGRPWWDFLSYAPGLPPLLVRVTPDAFTEALRVALDLFYEKYTKALATVQAMF